MFELTNKQRKYLGLTFVPSTWELVELIPSPYDMHYTFVYFDGDTIRKRIIVGENQYAEYDLYEETTNNRTQLLPKTTRGKIVKLTSSTLEKRTPMGMYFSYYEGYINLARWETNRTFYNSYNEDVKLKSFDELVNWIKQWIENTTASDMSELADFLASPNRHYKYKVGDFFRVKLNRSLYGYGRILLDYDKMRKDKVDFWDVFMGKPLVVKLYHLATSDKNVSCEYLRTLKAMPSEIIMDNALYYGEYEIIGNLALTDSGLDFPVMYGKSIDFTDLKNVLLQSGAKYYKLKNETSLVCSDFKNNGVGFGLYANIEILKKCIKCGSNQPYWEQNNFMTNKDLRNPKFFAERKAICKQFGVAEKDIFMCNN